MAKRTIQIDITARDQTSQAVSSASGALQRLSRGATQVGAQVAALGSTLRQFGSRVREAFSSADAMRQFLGVTPQVEGFRSAIGALVGELGSAAGVIGGFGAALYGAFRFGELGAQVEMTTSAFDNMVRSIGVAPDLLDRMRAAANGTVSDMSMMSSVMTLLIGTQGDLARALAESSPRLMEIAAAAHRLNPALGDTTFLFDSLARGIKRGSPMILDNLGLTINLERAYQRYADSIGKSVDELTAQERQIALLNEVLQAGNTIIEQAADVNSDMADSYAQAATRIQNAKDALARDFTPVVANVLEGLAGLAGMLFEIDDAFEEQEARIRATSSSYDEYRQRMSDLASAGGAYYAMQVMVSEAEFRSQQTREVLIEQFERSGAAMQRARDAAGGVAQGIGDVEDAAAGAAEPVRNFSASIDDMASAFTRGIPSADDMWRMVLQTGRAAGMSIEALGTLAERMGVATDAEVQATLAGFRLIEAWENGQIGSLQLAEATGLLTTAQQELRAADDAARSGNEDLAQSHRDAAQAAIEQASRVADLHNRVSSLPRNVRIGVDTSGIDSAISSAERLLDLMGQLWGNQARGRQGAGHGQAEAQTGMPYVPADMPVFVHHGEAILTAEQARAYRAAMAWAAPQNIVSNDNRQFNLTVNTAAATPSVYHDFHMLMALAGR